jgi:RND family efflux transporter MFP subunit
VSFALLLENVSKNFSVPVLMFVWCAMWSGYISATDEEPLPVFDCVIEPSEIVDLGSAVPGLIDMIYARRSDSISKGEVVASLDSSVANANAILSKARAELTTSINLRQESAAFGRRTSERNHALYQKKAISIQEIDKLDTENRIAQLQVRQEKDNKKIAALTYDRARAVLDRHSIRSPIAGVVMERFKSVGEYIEDDPVMRIAQIDPLHVEIILPVKYIGRLVPGRHAEITPNVPGYLPRVATVSRVDKVADAASGTFGARLILPNPDHSVAGGLRCSLSFLPIEQSTPKLSRQAHLNSEMQAKVRRETVEVQQRPVQQAVESMIEMTGARQCYRIGPLANKELVGSLSESISALDRANERRPDVEYKENTGYRVTISFEQDLGARIDAEQYLTDIGVKDFYLIGSAEDEVRFSVGFFGNELNALAQQQRLLELGVDSQLSVVQRESSWINLSFNSGQAFRGQLKSLIEKSAPAASLVLAECSQQQN